VKNLWRDAVIERLINCGAYQRVHHFWPAKALDDLIEQEARIALDPAVSKEARDLLYTNPPTVPQEKLR